MYRIEYYASISFFFFNLIIGFFLSEPHARKDIVWKAQKERLHTHYSIIGKVIALLLFFFHFQIWGLNMI